MTAAKRRYLKSLSVTERAQLASDARNSLRLAWSARHKSFRAPFVIRSNVAMLRDLEEV